MKQVIIISGYRGTMKTTVANRLSKDLDVVCLRRTSILESLSRSLTWTDKYDKLGLKIAAHNLMIKLMQEVLEATQRVILVSNFNEKEIIDLLTLCKMREFDTINVFLSGDNDIIYERFVTKQKYTNPINKIDEITDFKTFFADLILFDETLYGEDVIDVDTTDYSEYDYLKIRKQVLERLR